MTVVSVEILNVTYPKSVFMKKMKQWVLVVLMVVANTVSFAQESKETSKELSIISATRRSITFRVIDVGDSTVMNGLETIKYSVMGPSYRDWEAFKWERYFLDSSSRYGISEDDIVLEYGGKKFIRNGGLVALFSEHSRIFEEDSLCSVSMWESSEIRNVKQFYEEYPNDPKIECKNARRARRTLKKMEVHIQQMNDLVKNKPERW